MATFKVFDPKVVRDLANQNIVALRGLNELQKGLNGRFAFMSDAVLALVLAVASGEPLLLIGPPGTAKSRLIRTFCHLTGLIDLNTFGTNREQPQSRYFEYLLTPFTEPGELFGDFTVTQTNGTMNLVRSVDHTMPLAEVVYLDEVFNASSAILNSILTIVNERIYHDRGKRTAANLSILFGATNHLPTGDELRAIYDRFLLRCYVHNVDAKSEDLKTLLTTGWVETFTLPKAGEFDGLLERVSTLRGSLKVFTEENKLKVQEDSDFIGHLSQRVSRIRDSNLSEMSNRRLIKMLKVMLLHAMLDTVSKSDGKVLRNGIPITFDQLDLLHRFATDRPDEVIEGMLINGRGP